MSIAFLVFVGFLVQSSAVFAASSQWFYGENVCAGGYQYEEWQECEDLSAEPIIRMFRDADECGGYVEGQYYQPNPEDYVCRHTSHGFENFSNSPILTFSIGKVSFSRDNYANTIQEAWLLDKCKALADSQLSENPTPAFTDPNTQDQIYTRRNNLFLKNVSSQSEECTEWYDYGVYKDCTVKTKYREAECWVEKQWLIAKFAQDETNCPATQRPLPKECEFSRTYPIKPQLSCGPIREFQSNPYTHANDIQRHNVANAVCLTGDDLPDQTAGQLSSKVDFLLAHSVYQGTPTSRLIYQKNVAMLRYLLKTRMDDFTEAQRTRVWALDPYLRFIEPSDSVVFSESELKIEVGGVIDTLNGERTQIRASLPRYADGVAFCFDTLDNCKSFSQSSWSYLSLDYYAGTRYVYSGLAGVIPDKFVLKGMLGGKTVYREIVKGQNDHEELEPSLLATGKLFAAFSHHFSKEFKVIDLGDATEVKNLAVNGVVSPNREKAFQLDNTDDGMELVEWDIKTGARTRSWIVSAEFARLTFRGDEPLLTSGQKVFDPVNNQMVTLAESDNVFYRTNFVTDGTYIAADVDNHKVQVWELATGLLKHTITYEPEISYPVSDYVAFINGQLAVKSHSDEKMRFYSLANGTLVKEIAVASDAFVFTSDKSKILYGSGEQIRIVDTSSGEQTSTTINAEPNLQRTVIYATDGLAEALVKSRKIVAADPNNPTNGPLPAIETIEVWDLTTSQRKQSVSYPEGLQFVGLVHGLEE